MDSKVKEALELIAAGRTEAGTIVIDAADMPKIYAALASLQPAQSAVWSYCPECGCAEWSSSRYAKGQICDNCGQEWFSNVDYTDVILKHIGEWHSDRAASPLPQSTLSTDAQKVRDQALQFANHVINGVFEGGDWDGGELQSLAVQYGLLKPVEMRERCGEACSCAENGADFPATCFRKTYLGDIRALQSQPAEKDAEDAIRAAIQGYYADLDARKHGGVAMDNAFRKIEQVLGMQWIQGAAIARKENDRG